MTRFRPLFPGDQWEPTLLPHDNYSLMAATRSAQRMLQRDPALRYRIYVWEYKEADPSIRRLIRECLFTSYVDHPKAEFEVVL